MKSLDARERFEFIHGFRDYQVAAPLKSRDAITCIVPPVVFPRLSSRGPIEVCRAARDGAEHIGFRDYQVAAPLKCGNASEPKPSPSAFPRLSSRGPIEVACRRPQSRTQAPFPRLSSRGPIEVREARQDWVRDRGFRDYQVAAPLKYGRSIADPETR